MISRKRKERDFIEKEQSDSSNYEQVNQKLKTTSNSQFFLNDFTKIKISMDGNCLFRAILHFLCGIDKEHGTLRKIICDYIINHKEIYSEYFDGGEETLKQEIKEMSKDDVWGTIVELYAASELFSFNFKVLNSHNLSLYCSCFHFETFPTLYLEFENRNHFNLLLKKDDKVITFENKNEKKSQKSFLNKKKSKTALHDKTKTKENLISLKKQQEFPNRIEIELSKPRTKLHRKIYPPSRNNGNAYNEIFQYYTEKKIPERFLPLAMHQKRFQNWVKDIKKSYSLDKVSQNSLSLSRLRFKKENNKEVIIPYEDEIQKIIEYCHKSFGIPVKKHFGIKITSGNINLKCFYWANMSTDIYKFISHCSDCVQIKHEPPLKEKKNIIPKEPLERLQGDLIHLSPEQISACNKNYHYILSVVDHFSKYKWCFALKEKKGKAIQKCLESVITTFGPPSIFQTDNGREFKNSTLESFLKSNNIEFINGSVRHPQSQGLVERHNRELKEYLWSAFNQFLSEQENDEEWNLPLDLETFRVRENNRFHTVIKNSPNTIIISKDERLLKKVRENIENYYKKDSEENKNQISNLLIKGTKVFIVQNVIPNRNHNRLNKQKNSKVTKSKQKPKIPAMVVSDYKREDTSVKIHIVTQNIMNLKLNHLYSIHANLLSVPTETSWNIVFSASQKY